MTALNRTMLRTSRLLDFASEKELVAQTGHKRGDWPLVILKELFDNSLDACEEAGVAPVISVVVDGDGITFTDNGPGLPADIVPHILDFGIRVSSREAYVSPTRGAQGNALKTIVAMPFVLDGERGQVEIEARGCRHLIEFTVDQIRQEPMIEHKSEPVNVEIGTRINVRWPDSASAILHEARYQFLQIAADYAWLNPHATVTVDWFGEQDRIEATDAAWAKWKPSDPTSPHWYDSPRFERLVAGYISHDRDNGRVRTVRELVAEFRGLSASAKQKLVLDSIGLTRAPLTGLLNGNGIDAVLCGRLLSAMQGYSKPVKPAMLGVIGQDHFRRRFADAGCEMDSFKYQRVSETTDGMPWVIEAAFAWSPDAAAGRRLVTGINWSPAIRNPFRDLGGCSLDTLLAEQWANHNEPVILALHLVCPRVEHTDRGKSAVALSGTTARAISSVYPAPAVRHRGRLACCPSPRPGAASPAPVHGQPAFHEVVPPN
jgi:DNA topoisomerase VI subunit B